MSAGSSPRSASPRSSSASLCRTPSAASSRVCCCSSSSRSRSVTGSTVGAVPRPGGRGQLAGSAPRHRHRGPGHPELDALGCFVHQPEPARWAAPRQHRREVHHRRPAARRRPLLIEVAESLPDRVPGQRATAGYGGGGAYSVTVPLPGPAHVGPALSLYLALALVRGPASWPRAGRRRERSHRRARPAGARLEVVAPTPHLGDAERELVLATLASSSGTGPARSCCTAEFVPDHIRFIVSGHASARGRSGGQPDPVRCRRARRLRRADRADPRAHPQHRVAADLLTVLVVPLATLDDLVRHPPPAGVRDRHVDRAEAEVRVRGAGHGRGGPRSAHPALAAPDHRSSDAAHLISCGRPTRGGLRAQPTGYPAITSCGERSRWGPDVGVLGSRRLTMRAATPSTA